MQMPFRRTKNSFFMSTNRKKLHHCLFTMNNVNIYQHFAMNIYLSQHCYTQNIQGVPELADQIETVYSLMVMKVKNV
jgi:hypothetical protein